jgi:hypothetical protein
MDSVFKAALTQIKQVSYWRLLTKEVYNKELYKHEMIKNI